MVQTDVQIDNSWFLFIRWHKHCQYYCWVCTVFLPLGIFQDNLVPVSEVNLFKPLHAKITQALSGTKYRFSYGCCTDWQSLAWGRLDVHLWAKWWVLSITIFIFASEHVNFWILTLIGLLHLLITWSTFVKDENSSLLENFVSRNWRNILKRLPKIWRICMRKQLLPPRHA